MQKNEHFSRIICHPKGLLQVSGWSIDWERWIEHRKSSIRGKAAHTFRTGKCQFNYRKAVYRSLHKIRPQAGVPAVLCDSFQIVQSKQQDRIPLCNRVFHSLLAPDVRLNAIAADWRAIRKNTVED